MDADQTALLQDRVRAASGEGTALRIIGGGSKDFYGRTATGENLSLSRHRGVLRYEPTELVLKARAGTTLMEIESLLAQNGQMLAFEPPHFGESATLGGTMAAGFSGPRRPFTGSARDFTLGCTLLNGHGEVLSFGGEVMKNVAGFDVSRLMIGAMGTLGVLLDITLKVLPRPEAELSLTFEMPSSDALAAINRWCAESWPISGLAFDGVRVFLRLAGAEKAVWAAARQLGGDHFEAGDVFWNDLREQRQQFFMTTENLWRISVAPASPIPDLPGEWFYDWGGALRWLKSEAPAPEVFAAAQALGGHAFRFRGKAVEGEVFQPLPPAQLALHRRLKQTFDPAGIFNPGRMYRDL